MKSKQEKYQEAVKRNLCNAQTVRRQKYRGKNFEFVKTALGIRNTDRSYDKQIEELIKIEPVKEKKI